MPVFRMIARHPYTMVTDIETGEQVPLYGYRFLINISPEVAALMKRLKIP